MTIELLDGSQHELEIVGSYQLNYDVNPYRTNSGLLMSSDLLKSLGEPQSLLLFARFPASQLASTAEKLGIALPQAIVLYYLAFFERFVATYHNLFIFALAMASLSLLAGILLIANAVSLALIHRRYELGVLKAVKAWPAATFWACWPWNTPLWPPGSYILAVIAVQIFLVVMGLINFRAASLLQLNWPIALGLILAACPADFKDFAIDRDPESISGFTSRGSEPTLVDTVFIFGCTKNKHVKYQVYE